MSADAVAREPIVSTEVNVWHRTIWQIMPLMVACNVIATIDRSNIGFAKLHMLHDLSMSEITFGFGASLFYFGYVLFEIPSALASHKFGAPGWFARILLTWGIITLLLGFTQSAMQFYFFRFALGMAEAGLYPAQIFYLSLWFSQKRRAGALGVLTLGSAFGNGLSAIICAPLLQLHAFGLAGWQWIFIVTGSMPILIAPLVLAILPRKPQAAKFLSEEEKSLLLAGVEASGPKIEPSAGSIRALLSRRLIWPIVVYVCLMISLYGIIYWAPSIYQSLKVSDTDNGFLVAVPWLLDAIALIVLPRRLQSIRAVDAGLCCSALLAAVSFAIAATIGGPGVKFVALCIGIPSISVAIALFWTKPLVLFKGTKSVVAIGLISTLGSIGGIFAQNGMPRLAQWSGSPSTAMWLPGVCMLLVALLALGKSAIRET